MFRMFVCLVLLAGIGYAAYTRLQQPWNMAAPVAAIGLVIAVNALWRNAER